MLVRAGLLTPLTVVRVAVTLKVRPSLDCSNVSTSSTAPAPVVAAVFRALNIEAHSIAGKISEDSFNPMVNVQYDATDDLMLYASFARGTKAGGFDIRSNSLPTSRIEDWTSCAALVTLSFIFLSSSSSIERLTSALTSAT